MSAVDFIIVVPVVDEQLGIDKTTRYTRAQALTLIWRHTHRDFKSTSGNRAILVSRRGQGTCIVPLDGLTDEEINDKLPYCHKLERQRLAAKAAA